MYYMFSYMADRNWVIYNLFFFFFNATAPTEIYPYCHPLSLHDALPISTPRTFSSSAVGDHSCTSDSAARVFPNSARAASSSRLAAFSSRSSGRFLKRKTAPSANSLRFFAHGFSDSMARRSEEHTSELQSLMRISYSVFCLKKKQH